jgi:hypothetical protein
MEQITKKLRNRTMSAGLALLAMLATALTGCSQDDSKAADATGQGEAQVTLSVGGIVEGASGSIEKAAAQGQTVVVPADNSGMLMECTLEATEASKTRTTTPLTTGYKYRFAILDNSTNAVVAEDAFTSGTPGYLTGLTGSTTYKYIAVSYNSTTDPGTLGAVGSAPTSISGINPSTDLLYASGSFTTAASGSVEVPITFSHKFAQVTAQASASYNSWTIGVGSTIAATLATGYTANLATADGTLSSTGTAATQSFDFSSATADTLVSSTARTVYVAGDSMTLSFANITINGTAYTGKSVTFPQTLAEGSSYTLKIKFRTPIFAGCNIYWTGSKLTFDAAGTTTNQNYQGVFFQWGSLVGISPARTSSSVSFAAGSTPIYVPTYNSTTPSSSSWTATNATAKGWTWTTIPYVSTSPSTFDRTSSYLNDADRNTTAMWTAYKGDICLYLGATGAAPSGYRLPHSEEFGSTSGNWSESTAISGWLRVGGATWTSNNSQQDGYSNGRYNGLTTGGSFKTGTIFPASGYRVFNSGAISWTGYLGYYRSASPSSTTYSYELAFFSDQVVPGDAWGRQLAIPVRCVKN